MSTDSERNNEAIFTLEDSYLTSYKHKYRMMRDIHYVLQNISTLEPRSGVLNWGDDSTIRLIYLSGTIPMFYNRKQYNIPIDIWMTEEYPLTAPIPILRPTLHMHIKPGHRFVSPAGKVSIPYLDSWHPDRHHLMELIEYLTCTFGDDPPIFSKVTSSRESCSTIEWKERNSTSDWSETSSASTGSEVSTKSEWTTTDKVERSSIASSSRSSFSKSSSRTTSEWVVIREEVNVDKDKDVIESLGTYNRGELLAHVSAMIRKEVHDQHRVTSSEIESQKEIKKELLEVSEDLSKDYRQIKGQSERMDRDLCKLICIEGELDNWLQNISDGEGDVDELLIARDNVMKQYLETHAEIQAIEDTMFQLDAALSMGITDLTTFLKEIRRLSKREFLKKQLLNTISEQQQERFYQSESKATS